jgi:cell shape-determining protein MreC
MLFTWLTLAGLICLFSPPRLTGKLQLVYARLFSWPLATGRGLTIAARPMPQPNGASATEYERLMAANRRLKNHVANLNQRLTEAHRQIDQLAGLRVVPQWDNMGFTPADVIAATGQVQNELFVNRGQADKIAVKQFVLAENSLVGTVCDVSDKTAKVRLITDPMSKIPVLIGASNIPGVMEGQGSNRAKISLVPATRAVQKGDPVRIRKTPGLLDSPIITAEVIDCKRDAENPVLWDITVQPVCDIANAAKVWIVVSAPQPK